MTHLKLVENPPNPIEKRIIPHYPFCFLTFKSSNKVFEVREISLTGAQFLLKDGKIDMVLGQEIEGELHWKGKSHKIWGSVVWVRDQRFGLIFKNSQGIFDFLKDENVLAAMQILHKNPLNIEFPANLKYWLHSDGPVEIIIYDHMDGEWGQFQIIHFKNFIEWVDGVGVKTGIVLTRRDLETSIFDEEEFLFQIDKVKDQAKIKGILPLLEKIPNDFLPSNVIDFLKLKLIV